MKTKKMNEGFVLTAVMMLIVIASLVGGAFLVSARNSYKTAERWQVYDECLLAAQYALEKVNYDMYITLKDHIYETSGNSRDSLDILANQDFTVEVVIDGVEASASGGMSIAASQASSTGLDGVVATVSVVSGDTEEVVAENRSSLVLTCESVVTLRGVTRRIREKVTYDYNDDGSASGSLPSSGDRGVYNYVFFIDNEGYFSGVNCDFNGDVGANLDIDLKYSSIRLCGDAFAGGECTSKKLYKSYDWDDYGDQSFAELYFGDKVRPMLYTDGNSSNPDSYYEQGYAEGVNFYEDQEYLELPFIGPLSDYEEYAVAISGTAGDSSKTVAGVWGDDAGEDAGVDDTDVDDGCLVLVGTEADPIDISGVVVAQKDIYIRGYYTGQGTLYAGRNIYVVDDVIAVDAPTWPHPDSTPAATAVENKTKDFLGLCAKGSLIFGDYTTLDTSYLKSPHTDSHATDVTDAALGYVTHYVDGEPYFDGDYTQLDGNGSELRTDNSSRHFFEPILSDADMDAIGVTHTGMDSWVGHFDCVLYANHLIAGDFDPNSILNGAFICRDEAVKRHGNLALNWDARLGALTMDGDQFYGGLPGMMLPAIQPLPSRTIQWAEVTP